MLFDLKESELKKLVCGFERDKYYYLNANTTMFGDSLRLGDFVMYTTYLFYLKQHLIYISPDIFNQNNLYFKLNRIGGLLIGDILSTMSLFPSVWRGFINTNRDKHNINQIVTGGNIWSFKTYLTDRSIGLTNKQYNGLDIISLNSYNIKKDIAPNKVFILPVRNKLYNTERNLTDSEIVSIVNNIPMTNLVTIISKDNGIDVDSIRRQCGREIEEIGDNVSWLEIVLLLAKECRKYISGDCGFSHLVSALPLKFRPRIELYYRTTPFKMTSPTNKFDRLVNEINFIPYDPYLTDSIQIKN